MEQNKESENQPTPETEVLTWKEKGVPHEVPNGRVSYGVRHLLNNATLPGIQYDEDGVFDATYDCPGQIVRGRNADGTWNVIADLTPGMGKPVQREPGHVYQAPVSEPCPRNCGGTLINLNKKMLRCNLCGANFQDNLA